MALTRSWRPWMVSSRSGPSAMCRITFRRMPCVLNLRETGWSGVPRRARCAEASKASSRTWSRFRSNVTVPCVCRRQKATHAFGDDEDEDGEGEDGDDKDGVMTESNRTTVVRRKMYAASLRDHSETTKPQVNLNNEYSLLWPTILVGYSRRVYRV